MGDRPIIFSAPMARALLDGRKTQTRRLLQDVPEPPKGNCAAGDIPRHGSPYLDAYCGDPKTETNPRGMSQEWCWWQIDDRPGATFRVGFAPGDRLWVREAWRTRDALDHTPPREMAADEPVWWQADGASLRGLGDKPGRLRPSILMPRWAARLTLLVTEVRVQRLHEISDEDAMAEGVTPCPLAEGEWWVSGATNVYPTALGAFADLWSGIHGSWEANPWVAAITFRPLPRTEERR